LNINSTQKLPEQAVFAFIFLISFIGNFFPLLKLLIDLENSKEKIRNKKKIIRVV